MNWTVFIHYYWVCLMMLTVPNLWIFHIPYNRSNMALMRLFHYQSRNVRPISPVLTHKLNPRIWLLKIFSVAVEKWENFSRIFSHFHFQAFAFFSFAIGMLPWQLLKYNVITNTWFNKQLWTLNKKGDSKYIMHKNI